jgi:hypothetical protein
LLKGRNNVLDQLEGNAAKLVGLARELGYYPELDPPIFNQQGGLVIPGFILTMATQFHRTYFVMTIHI